MCSGIGHWTWLMMGSPIRKSSDQSLVGSSPRLIAAPYVLHRLLVPRHPPCALNNLATKIKDARVHCAVLKVRATIAAVHRVLAGCCRSAGRSMAVMAGRVRLLDMQEVLRAEISAPSGLNSVPTSFAPADEV